MAYRKKLIEVTLPLTDINEASGKEKRNPFLKQHPRILHYWWARRPLASARAVIFTCLVDDPESPDTPPKYMSAVEELPLPPGKPDTLRQRLFAFIERLVDWDSRNDPDLLAKAHELIRLCTSDSPPPVLDPFTGGGIISIEAQRLGLEAFASDLNPVAVLINKALVELPSKYVGRKPVHPRDTEKLDLHQTGDWADVTGLAEDVEWYGNWILERAEEKLHQLFPRTVNGNPVLVWFWARSITCPNPACRGHMPLVKSFDLSTKKNDRVWLDPIVDKENRTVTFAIRKDGQPSIRGTVRRRKVTCLYCGQRYPQSVLRDQANESGFEESIPLAMYVQSRNDRVYREFTGDQFSAALSAKHIEGPPGEILQASQYMGPTNYGFTHYSELFTRRQLIALTAFSDLVKEAHGLVYEHSCGDRDYADAIATYLGLTVSRLAAHCNTACIWWATSQILIQAFAGQGLPMTWDYAETNPLEGMVSWKTALRWITEGLLGTCPRAQGHASMHDAAKSAPKTSAPPFVCTDPPYYNNVPYADLSDFFYVWLRRTLQDIHPDVLGTIVTPKADEIVATPYHFGGDQDAAEEHFETRLKESFSRVLDYAEPELPMVLYYAFRQAEETGSSGEVVSTGWETMLKALIDTGYQITATWPMRTETQGGLRHYGRNSLASSIIIVCRPRSKDATMISRRDFIKQLRQELPTAMREMQSGDIAPVDMAQASIGPGIAIYSRYSKVLEPNGERLTVRTALQLINHELEAYLAEQEGHIDEDSRFAVAWFEQFGFKEGPFGQADVLARAKNTSVDGLAYAGVLESGAGKVRLYHWSELDPGWDPATDKRLAAWEATHHLIERLNTYGEEGAARLLAKMPPNLAAEARQLAYRLYSICERKGWAEHARDYNALVISWSASQEQAREFKEQYQQGRLL